MWDADDAGEDDRIGPGSASAEKEKVCLKMHQEGNCTGGCRLNDRGRGNEGEDGCKDDCSDDDRKTPWGRPGE